MSTVNYGNIKLEKEESMMTIELGKKVVVSDPCYNLDTWCQGVIENVKPGMWKCECESWEGRISSLIISHIEHPEALPTKPVKFEVGVDSGTAGIFDYDYYAQYHEGELDEDWYDKNVCNQVEMNNRMFITDGKGVWSESGYGDGGYDCFVSEFNGEIVAISIIFIDKDYEEDDEDDDWDEED